MAIIFSDNSKLKIATSCEISNWDPKKGKKPKNGLIFNLNADENKKINPGNIQQQLLKALAGANNDDEKDILTEKDLKQANEYFKNPKKYITNATLKLLQKLGVVEFRYAEKDGIANITTKKGDVLRIDLDTRAEQAEKGSKQTTATQTKTSNSASTNKTSTSEKIDSSKKTEKQIKEQPKTKIEQESMQTKSKAINTLSADTKFNRSYNMSAYLLRKMGCVFPPDIKTKDKRYAVPKEAIPLTDGISSMTKVNFPKQFRNIPKEYTPYIAKISENTGLSVYFIKHLLSTEAFIGKAKNIGDGEITLGFGHTVKKGEKYKEGDPISLNDAFILFEKDLKKHEEYARFYFTPKKGTADYGKYKYDDFATSFKEALVDIAYNRGNKVMASDEIYKSLRANFSNGLENMPAAAVRTRQEKFKNPDMEGGLRKRNVYRFLLAIRDLPGEYKLAAMRRFDRNERDHNGNIIKSYFTKTKEMLNKTERIQLQADWDAAVKAAQFEAQLRY